MEITVAYGGKVMPGYKNPISTYEVKSASKDAKERKEYWNTGIGLNQVDGLEPSSYLIDLAKKNIEGEINTEEVKQMLAEYYKDNVEKNRHYECDIVSTRIVELLDQGCFTFSPQMLKSIHKYLFEGVFEKEIVGVFRKNNITKKESILNGDTVNYGNWNMIDDLYGYDFEQEKEYHYSYPITEKQLKHLADFVSRIWQVHPFMEGNTRTTAVFIELYLRSMGYDVNNDMFKSHAVYFRGALVRSNYRNVKTGVTETDEFLYKFFANLLKEGEYKLDERDLVCNGNEPGQNQRISENSPKADMLQDMKE